MRRPPRQRLYRRIALVSVIAATTAVVMLRLDMQPRLTLVGLIVVAGAAAAACLSDLADLTVPIRWRHHAPDGLAAPPDHRVRILRFRLHEAGRRGWSESEAQTQNTDELVASLAGVVDDHLRAEHGIDRAQDPEAAAAVLGPELSLLVDDPITARAMAHPRRLAHTVGLVERLTRTDPMSVTTSPRELP